MCPESQEESHGEHQNTGRPVGIAFPEFNLCVKEAGEEALGLKTNPGRGLKIRGRLRKWGSA